MAEYTDEIEKCNKLLDAIYASELDKIRANLEIGKIVGDMLASSSRGDGAIDKFASELTKKRGRTVYPQRLYEAYDVYRSVGTMEKVAEIQKGIGEDITWNWLVRNATKDFATEPDKTIKKEKIQRTIRQVENAAGKIELMLKEKQAFDEDEAKQVEGAVLMVSEVVQKFLSAPAVSAAEVADESNEATRILLEYFEYDEVTEAFTAPLEIHALADNSDIDSAIVVTRQTHEKIHRGEHQPADIKKIIAHRNVNFAKLFLTAYLANRQAEAAHA